MKLNVGLIGKGKWGSILKSKLFEIANLKFVLGKNKNYLDFIRDPFLGITNNIISLFGFLLLTFVTFFISIYLYKSYSKKITIWN